MPEVDITKVPDICHTLSHNHKFFHCEECEKDFYIREESKLNICFPCKLLLCDNCLIDHFIEKNNYFRCDKCAKIFDNKKDLIEYDKMDLCPDCCGKFNQLVKKYISNRCC